MKTLHLNVKKKWFDMILSGEKKEEYRQLKPYWTNRLFPFNGERYSTVTFSNGYAKDRPQFVIKLISITYREGVQEWGAEPSVQYYVIKLGKIITKKAEDELPFKN